LIALDSSVLVDFFSSRLEPRNNRGRELIRNGHAVIAPATLTELLSAPKGGRAAREILDEFAMLAITDGYWERAGLLRAAVLQAGRKAALGDSLIAQACIDNDVQLLTREAYEALDESSVVYPEMIAPMRGTPYGLRISPLLGPLGAPCNPPPWGVLQAVDLKSGKLLWESRLGTTRDQAPFLQLHAGQLLVEMRDFSFEPRPIDGVAGNANQVPSTVIGHFQNLAVKHQPAILAVRVAHPTFEGTGWGDALGANLVQRFLQFLEVFGMGKARGRVRKLLKLLEIQPEQLLQAAAGKSDLPVLRVEDIDQARSEGGWTVVVLTAVRQSLILRKFADRPMYRDRIAGRAVAAPERKDVRRPPPTA